jgi:hypothetical protein
MSRTQQWSAGDLFSLAGALVGQGRPTVRPRAGPGGSDEVGQRARPRRARPGRVVVRGYTWARQALSLMASGTVVEKYSTECDF